MLFEHGRIDCSVVAAVADMHEKGVSKLVGVARENTSLRGAGAGGTIELT